MAAFQYAVLRCRAQPHVRNDRTWAMIRPGMTTQSARPISGSLRAVVWDFNGTLIDDVGITVHSLNVLLARRELPLVDMESYRRCVGFPLCDYYARIGLDVANEGMSSLAEEFYAIYLPLLSACPVHRGVVEVLQWLDGAGIEQFVLSASEEGVVRSAVVGLGVDRYFSDVLGLDHCLVDSKIERGRQLLRSLPFAASEMLLVGDTDHDAEVGDALGISVLLVAQGHQDEQRLLATRHHVLESFEALRQTLIRCAPKPYHP
ncbi:HAD family hydrolase [Candidatus Bipolaricaulota bacterium]|nr:HAD family hydrolase [Candidatus Bipolaricaulota bacterium]